MPFWRSSLVNPFGSAQDPAAAVVHVYPTSPCQGKESLHITALALAQACVRFPCHIFCHSALTAHYLIMVHMCNVSLSLDWVCSGECYSC